MAVEQQGNTETFLFSLLSLGLVPDGGRDCDPVGHVQCLTLPDQSGQRATSDAKEVACLVLLNLNDFIPPRDVEREATHPLHFSPLAATALPHPAQTSCSNLRDHGLAAPDLFFISCQVPIRHLWSSANIILYYPKVSGSLLLVCPPLLLGLPTFRCSQ